MRIHILGICGTFMGGVAVIAKQLGFAVSGSDANVYPPMSDALRDAGITVCEGYDTKHLQPHPDLVIIGNALSRGNPAIEYVLNQNIPYISGPQWLAEYALKNRHVIAISGTHGKTTTTSLLTWILMYAGLNPGYLVGGRANNFFETAALGSGEHFVIEADEYDSAFFDKRSKFIHYRPKTLVINNLEYDHADIFPSLDAIKQQFHYVVRTVPSNGHIIYHLDDANVQDVIDKGCWSNVIALGNRGEWFAKLLSDDGSVFEIWHQQQKLGIIEWSLIGKHNVSNAIAAIAAAVNVGVSVEKIIAAFKNFKGVKRRLEVRGVINDVTIYDDFAHHPTAIKTTLAGLRARIGQQRIVAVLQFGSNTMILGDHLTQLPDALNTADEIILLQPEKMNWNANELVQQLDGKAKVYPDVANIVEYLKQSCRANDHVLIMSNKGFDGIHQKLMNRMSEAEPKR